jgi:hypothetical protein
MGKQAYGQVPDAYGAELAQVPGKPELHAALEALLLQAPRLVRANVSS